MASANCSWSAATARSACLGNRPRLRGTGTGWARRALACSTVRGMMHPTSEMNSST
ncbi:Uncharacterised protein [Mycobacteroides abscessus subsp. abscessus]|nr:Uncharacterised protein [Mycobacteroides abscessus subsp. abscessus]